MLVMKIIIALIAIILVSGSCPQNCSGHGKCKSDGVCECNEGITAGAGAGAGSMYMGADCSIRVCPSGDSYGAVLFEGLPNPDQNYRRALESILDRSVERRSRELGIAATEIKQVRDNFYQVSGVEYKLLSKGQGELMCYDELGEYKGKVKVFGKAKESDDYLIKLPSTISSDNFFEYDCRVSFVYNDMSLLNPVVSTEDTITWDIKDILDKVDVNVDINDVYFACIKDGVLTKSTTDTASSRRLLQNNNNIEFKFTTSKLADGLKCYYLGKVETDDTDGSKLLAASDVKKLSSFLLKDGVDIGLPNGKKMYEIYKSKVVTDNLYASLNCYNKYTNDLIGKTYLMGFDTTKHIAKVVYDFDEDVYYDPYDLKCEIIEKYNEITSLLPMKITTTDGSIVNKGIESVVTIAEGDTVELGCYNPKSYEFTTYLYTYTSGTFKIKPADPPSSRRRLADEPKPAKDDICYIAAGNDGIVNAKTITTATSFFKKHLILTGVDNKYKYYDENSIVYLPGERVANNIYILENITYITGSSGALIECKNENNNVIEIQILQKIKQEGNPLADVKLNKYYVKYNKNKIGSGEYKCQLVHLTDDLSLYELSKPNNCNAATIKDGTPNPNAKCELKLTSMSYFVTVLPENKKMDLTKDNDVSIACSRGDSIEMYDYEYKAPTPDANPASRRLADENTPDKSENVVLTIKEASTIVPSNNDICHIISYTPKTQTPRRVRRLADPADLTALTGSDYGKSLSNYIYKPSENITIDIGKINHKVYEVNNINIIPDGIDSYVGVISCKYGNNEGNGYVMGKSDNGYMILFDFINENSIPSINRYNCKLESSYNDLSLYYSSVIKGQGDNGLGECYKGKCDLKWTGMGKLLPKVSFTEKEVGKTTLATLTTASSTLKFACMNKAKKVTIYEYTTATNSDGIITFPIKTDSNSYPLIGHVCNILSGFNGVTITTDKNSDYEINPPNGAKLPPTLMSEKAAVSNIYKVRRFTPTPISIGYSVCKKEEGDGKTVSTIVAINYGKIRDNVVDSYYIRYTDEKGVDISNPTPESYSCGTFTYYEDLSTLIKATVADDCKDTASCGLTLTGYDEILKDLGYVIAGDKYKASFACPYTADKNELKIFSYESADGLSFTTVGSEFPLPSSECSLLLNKDGTMITEIAKSEIYKSPRLLPSTITYNSIKIYNAVNVDLKLTSELGISKCYNKYSNEYVGYAISYGKVKDNENNEYLIGYSVDPPKPELYNCKSFEEYSDLSMLIISQQPTTCTAANTCEITLTGILPLIKNYVDTTKVKDYTVGCEAGDELLEYVLTSDDSKKITPKPLPRILADDPPADNLVLYIKNDVKNTADLLGKVNNIKKCHLLMNVNGKTIKLSESDMSKFPYLLDYLLEAKLFTSYNLDYTLGDKPGKMTCYEKYEGKTSVDLLVYYKVENKNNYIVKYEGVADFSNYDCRDAVQLNDLSLVNPQKISTSKTITWTKMSRILNKFGFFTSKKVGDNINTKFVCIKDGSVNYADGSYTYQNKFVTEEEDVEFTLTVDSGFTVADTDICYLLSSFDGIIIAGDDIAKSDVGMRFGLKADTTNLPTATTLVAVESIGKGGVFTVTNVKYTLNNDIIINQCYDRDTHNYLGESYVLAPKNPSDLTAGYYIYYSWIKDAASPADYDCSESGRYSDISLLTEVNIGSTSTITLKGMADILTAMKITSASAYNFVCINSKKELHLYEYTRDNTNSNVFNIKAESEIVPYVNDKCYLLANTIGEKVNLSKSEYGKKNNIFTDDPNGQKVETTEKKVETVEPESIPAEIPKSGGILKCYDKESGEYVGTIEVIGKKANGEAIIKYNIQSGKMDISEEDLSIDMFETEVESISKDLSMKNPPKVSSICESNPNRCKLIWKSMGDILIDPFKLLMMRMRELVEKDIKFACPNKPDGVYKEVTFTYDDANIGSDLELTVKILPSGFQFMPNSQCNALVDGDGNEVDMTGTEFYSKAMINDEGLPFLPSDEKTITIGKTPNNVYQALITTSIIKEFSTVYFAKNQIPVPIDGSIKSQNLLSQISLGRTVEITCTGGSGSSCSGNSVKKVIIGIEKDDDLLKSPRLLLENERILADSLPGVVLQFDDLTGLTAAADSFTLSFPKTVGASHSKIECSGVGTCDRESGVCKCYNGFTGSACERMNCPNNCNNHGRCISGKELTKSISNGYGNDVVFGCLCDSGYRGADCSLKECPSEVNNGIKDRDCSNHGLCDYSDGSCKCFDGYYGEACQHTVGTA